jgi:hypothetical protein
VQFCVGWNLVLLVMELRRWWHDSRIANNERVALVHDALEKVTARFVFGGWRQAFFIDHFVAELGILRTHINGVGTSVLGYSPSLYFLSNNLTNRREFVTAVRP